MFVMGEQRHLMPAVVFAMVLLSVSNNVAGAQTENDADCLIKQYEDAVARDADDKISKRQLSVLYHNRALEMAGDGEWEQAITREEKALRLEPEEPVLKKTLAYFYNNYGLDLKDGGKLNKAIEILKKGVECAPEESQLKKNLAVVYLELAYDLFRKAEYENSERMVYNAGTHDPTNPYVYVLRGELAYAMDNYFKAQEEWSKALELNSGLYEVRLKLERLKDEKEQERTFNVREVENFKLKFEGLENQGLADSAADILREAYRELGQDYNLYPRAVIPVIIYPTGMLKTLDYFPDWAAGTYDGKIRFGVDLGKMPLMMKAVLYHEYTHVLVHILGGTNVPLWLNEGLAEYGARKFKKAQEFKERRKMIAKAIGNNTIFSIEKLSNLDLSKLSYLGPNRISLVYAQSESFVTYLVNRTSLYEMKQLLVRLGEGEGINRAVKDVLFVDLEVLERDWRSDYKAEQE